MKNIESLIPFIKTYLGETVGGYLIIVLILSAVYKSIFDSGLFQHLVIVVRFKRWKIDKEIKELTELIDHAHLKENVKNKYKAKLRSLYLQRQLLTKETKIEILDILSSYVDEVKAVRLYNTCKKVLRYKSHSYKLDFKLGHQITELQAKKHKNWALITYWLLATPAAVWVMYEHYHLIYKQPIGTDSNISFLIIFGVYVIWIFLLAYILRRFLRRSNAWELLNMSRIQ